MGKYEDVVAEAASALCAAGFAEAEIGSVYKGGWYGRVTVSPVLLLNIDEPVLAERLRESENDREQDVIIREDSQGFVDVIAAGEDVSIEWAQVEHEVEPSAHRVWIDVVTGTWGDVADLRVVDLDEQAHIDTLAGEAVDWASLVAALNSMSDSEICEYGRTYGKAME